MDDLSPAPASATLDVLQQQIAEAKRAMHSRICQARWEFVSAGAQRSLVLHQSLSAIWDQFAEPDVELSDAENKAFKKALDGLAHLVERLEAWATDLADHQ